MVKLRISHGVVLQMNAGLNFVLGDCASDPVGCNGQWLGAWEAVSLQKLTFLSLKLTFLSLKLTFLSTRGPPFN